jgi:hypothetical protein
MKPQTMHKVPVTLTKKQATRLMHGHTVQLKHENISHGRQHQHHLVLHHENVKKVHKAARNSKGCRLALSPEEIHHCMGSGIFDFSKNAWNTVKNKVIDTPFYQNTVRPLAKQGVNTLIDNFVPAAARDVAHKAADFAGDKTRAFGLRPHKKVALSNNMSRMIAPEHPSFNPGLPLRPIGGAVSHRRAASAPKKAVRRRKRNTGGSILPSGY